LLFGRWRTEQLVSANLWTLKEETRRNPETDVALGGQLQANHERPVGQWASDVSSPTEGSLRCATDGVGFAASGANIGDRLRKSGMDFSLFRQSRASIDTG
jgi:hypothetical protein